MCAEPGETALQLIVQVISDCGPSAPGCGVSVNGAWPVFARKETANLLFPAGPYARHVEEHRAWNYDADLGALRDGWNEIAVYNDSTEELNLVGLELGIVQRA